jgi:two-component system, NtrC family, response regulator HydG
MGGGATTVSVGDLPIGRDDASREAVELVIAWSAEEPHRIGEISALDPRGKPRVLGRGDEEQAGEKRVEFFRQRPSSRTITPTIQGRGISRRQLVLTARGDEIDIERVGKCATLLNGAPMDRAVARPGDTIHLRGQLLLLVVKRPAQMDRLQYLPEDKLGPFGEPDAFDILGESPAAWRLRDRLAFVAKAATHALLRGESGTGKELAARAIHLMSKRASKPLVTRNAATFPAGLIDAELFGNVKNYPNAGMPERPGLVGEADGGTLFLDEIGELPMELQAHLLRVLDGGGEYQRLGEARARKSDIRLVGATNRPPEALKHDLLARLTLRVELPSLNTRREDIPLLARHLLLRAAASSPEIGERFLRRAANGRVDPRLDPELVDALVRRSYTTHVRELDGLLWRAMAGSTGDAVRLTDDVREETLDEPAEGDASSSAEPTLEQIRDALEREGQSVTRAARALGLSSRYALYRLMKKHGLSAPENP